jgi:hypothetical protein
MKHFVCGSVLLVLLTGRVFAAPPPLSPEKPAPSVISSGKVVNLADKLMPDKPTLFVFYKHSSTLERDFLAKVSQDAGDRVGVCLIQLKTGAEPIAAKYSVVETPTAIVYDRRGREVSRNSNAEQILLGVKKAAGVMRLDWAEEGDAHYLASVKAMGRSPGTGILRTMTLQPEYLKHINDLSMTAHFSDGYLPRRVKEMIATYVSSLNKCKY